MPTINNNNESKTFTFRNKFEDRLVTDKNRPIFTAAFETFCKLSPDTARKILWRLTYNDEFLEANLQTLGLTLEIVPSDKVLTLRDELRYQYELLYPDFLAVEVPNECLEAFNALKNHTDSIVANIVYGNCLYASYFDALSMSQILDLLESNRENRYFRGLRNIGFSYKIAQYLKPYHLEIHDLLKALYQHNNKDVNSFNNTPFDKLSDRIKDAGIELPFTFGEETQVAVEPDVEAPNEAQVEQPAEANFGFKPLTPDAILEHKDVFTTFVESSDMNILLQIGELGFDLNKVIAKKEEISILLRANSKVQELAEMLLKVETLKKESESIMFEATKALID